MKNEMGQLTYLVDTGTNGVAVVIPKNEKGDAYPDMVSLSNGLHCPIPK